MAAAAGAIPMRQVRVVVPTSAVKLTAGEVFLLGEGGLGFFWGGGHWGFRVMSPGGGEGEEPGGRGRGRL